MSIKPVDFQIIVPRTTEISRISSEDMQKNLALQQQQTYSMQHKVENNLTQVYSQEKAQEARIRDKEEKNREGRKENKKKEDNKTGEKKFGSGERTNIIDIRL